MNIKTIAIAISLSSIAAIAGAQTTPGYDRPANNPVHQHVVYWNDTYDHYDMDMQIAADAYKTDDLIVKSDKKSNENYQKKHKTDK